MPSKKVTAGIVVGISALIGCLLYNRATLQDKGKRLARRFHTSEVTRYIETNEVWQLDIGITPGIKKYFLRELTTLLSPQGVHAVFITDHDICFQIVPPILTSGSLADNLKYLPIELRDTYLPVSSKDLLDSLLKEEYTTLVKHMFWLNQRHSEHWILIAGSAYELYDNEAAFTRRRNELCQFRILHCQIKDAPRLLLS
jgi:hypothetical protein